MVLHDPFYEITHSSFTGIYEQGALNFSSLRYPINIKYCTFIECQNSNCSGGAVRIDSLKDKNCTFCCFLKCSTTVKLGSNDLGQALFFINGSAHIEMISICKCPEVNIFNWAPIGLNNANSFMRSINETKNFCVGRCLVHAEKIAAISISYSSYFENDNENKDNPMIYSIDNGSFYISYCNFISNKGNCLIALKGLISHCCILGNDINDIPNGCDGGNNIGTELEIDVLSNCYFTFIAYQSLTTHIQSTVFRILGIFFLGY